MFTLSHHVILWLAANRVYPKRRFRDYGILGDDVVIADHKVAVEYRKILTDLGVMISGSKSLVSQTGQIFQAVQSKTGSCRCFSSVYETTVNVPLKPRACFCQG